MTFNRRETLKLAAAASALSLAGLGTAQAADGDMVDITALMTPAGGFVDKPVGNPDAPVTVIEYASPTCPHCAAFHNTTYEAFREAYIDTGRVQFMLRPLARSPLDAAVFMLAEAAGPENYHNVIATYFRTQNDWYMSDRARDAVFAVAAQLGFTEESFTAALTNQDALNAIEAVRDQAINEFDAPATPTFFINGKTVEGNRTLEQLAAEIDPLVPADFVAPAAAPTDAPAADAMAPAADAMAPAADAMAPAADAMAPAADAMAPAAPAQ